MSRQNETPFQWFQEAARWYVEKHQGCPWCGGANRVYRSIRRRLVQYHCGACDFLVCHEQDSDRYFMGPGHDTRAPATMHAL